MVAAVSTKVRPHASAKMDLVKAIGAMSADQFMRKYDLSAVEVAQMLGVSERSVREWASKKTPLDRRKALGSLAQHFENSHQPQRLVDGVSVFLRKSNGSPFLRFEKGIMSAYQYGLTLIKKGQF